LTLTSSAALIAGHDSVLYFMLLELRINGSYGLPNVWTKRSVADNLKPSNRKAKLKTDNIHHTGQSHNKVRPDDHSNCKCYQKLASNERQDKAI
jgi:hypothetical protein